MAQNHLAVPFADAHGKNLTFFTFKRWHSNGKQEDAGFIQALNFLNYSIIIPVLKLEGNPYLEDLLRNLGQQSIKPEIVHLVVGDKRQGRAINYGVSQAKSEYIATLDDDSFIDDPDLFKKLLEEMAEDDQIGMAGAACEIPPWATPFQKKAMEEIERRSFPTQKKTIDSDMVQHPCLIMPRAFFEEIGGEDEELIRGLDPVLRKKVRDAGKRVVIVANTWVYHLLPPGWASLVKMYYRNGKGSGYAQRHFPERVLELSDGYDGGSFVEKHSFFYRLSRRLIKLMSSLVQGKWLKISTDLAYGAGVLREKCAPAKMQNIPTREGVESSPWTGWDFEVKVHQVKLKA
ncbi:MAG: glycosyltransferase [Planctomycetes bacterium]|nr:glycosyltransferase [Planctomycetota bacterium]